MITEIRIDKVPIKGLNMPTSTAELNTQSGLLHFGKSTEWSMMVNLGLEEEFTTLVITHEEIHAIMERGFGIHVHAKRERLIHYADICALMGF